jgi:pyruvate dehydrogenase kinase 2/3/4
MAQGILEYKQQRQTNMIDSDMQQFLDRFYMSRIGIRMLIGQHSALYRGPFMKNYVGVICTRTNIKEIAQDAIANARFICEDHYGLFRAPEVKMFCPGDIEFMYVPSHLNHMVFELLKNSLRAVVERFGADYEDEYPPIKLVIAHGKEDITIKISDEGGGLPRSGIPVVWTYMVRHYFILFSFCLHYLFCSILPLKLKNWNLNSINLNLKHQWLVLVMVYPSLD